MLAKRPESLSEEVHSHSHSHSRPQNQKAAIHFNICPEGRQLHKQIGLPTPTTNYIDSLATLIMLPTQGGKRTLRQYKKSLRRRDDENAGHTSWGDAEWVVLRQRWFDMEVAFSNRVLSILLSLFRVHGK